MSVEFFLKKEERAKRKEKRLSNNSKY
ncbi:hypothetical protein BPO_0669 [Bergeyella porcorum]|uniref:Uncharacterized protein n=1 Tax=Bergeyella porcorum TaxID=1735111 RepID=A0AAU0EZL1_9FLAO